MVSPSAATCPGFVEAITAMTPVPITAPNQPGWNSASHPEGNGVGSAGSGGGDSPARGDGDVGSACVMGPSWSGHPARARTG